MVLGELEELTDGESNECLEGSLPALIGGIFVICQVLIFSCGEDLSKGQFYRWAQIGIWRKRAGVELKICNDDEVVPDPLAGMVAVVIGECGDDLYIHPGGESKLKPVLRADFQKGFLRLGVPVAIVVAGFKSRVDIGFDIEMSDGDRKA